MYNILIGGAAGQGIETTAAMLEKSLKRAGYSVFTSRDFMSRVRGGHNFSLIRFGKEPVLSHSYALSGIIALDQETVDTHINQLNSDGFLLCDLGLNTTDDRAIRLPLSDMAKGIGNPKVSNSIALGVVLKLFGESLDGLDEILSEFLDEKYIDVNRKAVLGGYSAVEARYPRQNGIFGDWMIVTGSQAIALGAMAAGLKLYSAYPMSPATPIMVYLADKGRKAGVVVEQAEDEIAAINMAIGASFAGARAMTGTSGGGFSLMVEGLGLAGIAEIPLVVVNVQRPGPATGLPTRTEQSDLKFMISASQGEFPRMVVAPKNHEDAFYQTVRAFDIAERYQMPVLILADQYLGDASATVKPFDLKTVKVSEPAANFDGEYLRYQYTESGISPRIIPGMSPTLVAVDSDEHDESGKITESAEVRVRMVDKRMQKLAGLKKELIEPDFLGAEDFDTLLIGWGSVYGPLMEAVALLNEKKKRCAALVFGDVFPLPTLRLIEKAGQAKRIINVEQNATGQLGGLIREYTGITCTGSILKYDGRQITGQEIMERVLGGEDNG